MLKTAVIVGKLDRVILTIYLIALLGLLIFPISGAEFRLLGVGADKWAHIAMFGGLAAILRWNISANRYAVFVSGGTAFAVAAVTEVVQALIAYRSGDLWDLLAGLLGASLGAIIMHRIMSSQVLAKSIGLLVVLLGIMIGALFGLADAIGVSNNDELGALQVAGIALGALIVLGGARAHLEARRGEPRS